MALKPILFNTAMVKAILDGRKTQTRRLIKPAPLDMTYEDGSPARKPPFSTGDILWVRETWQYIEESDTDGFYVYAADREDPAEWKWMPSIHMPRAAARLFLRVKDVRVERLQDISDADIKAEGTDLDDWYEYDEWQHSVAEGLGTSTPVTFETMRGFFGHRVWDDTLRSREAYDKYSWDMNPWVWVIEFERTEQKTPF